MAVRTEGSVMQKSFASRMSRQSMLSEKREGDFALPQDQGYEDLNMS